ncbi:MAG: hypothetical protein IJW24_04005, partial [Clostridia bacterium]|nr:hypothetical protein [Clostridia bacterium]
MKNIIKKLSGVIVALLICFGAMFTLVACGKDTDDVDESQVMNLSVNPSIEFVLDKDDEILSVSASNEDGAYLLQKFSDWVGMDADDAALKFLELAEEYGFVVKGETDGQKFTISVSGQEAQELYEDVKEEISTKATEFGLSIDSMVKIEKQKIEAKVAEMYQDYTSEQIEALSEEKLIELLKTSMDETKDLLTDDEKQAYYRERAQKVLETKMAAVDAYLAEHSAGLQGLLNSGLQALVDVMNGFYNTLKNTIFPELNDRIDQLYETATTGINAVRENYLAAKKLYLEKVQEYKDALEASTNPETDADVIAAKQAMNEAKSVADGIWESLDDARDAAKSTLMSELEEKVYVKISKINEKLDSIIASISSLKTEMETDVRNAITTLKNSYVSNAS